MAKHGFLFLHVLDVLDSRKETTFKQISDELGFLPQLSGSLWRSRWVKASLIRQLQVAAATIEFPTKEGIPDHATR